MKIRDIFQGQQTEIKVKDKQRFKNTNYFNTGLSSYSPMFFLSYINLISHLYRETEDSHLKVVIHEILTILRQKK